MLRSILFLVVASLAAAQRGPARPRTLDIYWIDVEGGAATLIVSPTGESLLVDTGFPGSGDRDAQRIAQAVVTAGITRIDHLVITHFHGDHVGGVAALAKLMPIRNFYDHGDNIEPNGAAQFNAYIALAGTKRTILKPGDKIALGSVDLSIVSAAGKVIENRLERGFFTNNCEAAEYKPEDKTENSQSVGFLLSYSKFSFLDVGDLTWDREMQLACPVNKIGEVSLFQATHHGFSNGQSGAPALVWSLRPQAVVVNNGARKGFSNGGYDVLAQIPGKPDIWQGHRGEANDATHNTAEERIANLSGVAADDKGYWIKASIAADGSFTLTNARNNFSKAYTPR
jgi:beta-lactamase superfamily II metal-dependent hydrolase